MVSDGIALYATCHPFRDMSDLVQRRSRLSAVENMDADFRCWMCDAGTTLDEWRKGHRLYVTMSYDDLELVGHAQAWAGRTFGAHVEVSTMGVIMRVPGKVSVQVYVVRRRQEDASDA